MEALDVHASWIVSLSFTTAPHSFKPSLLPEWWRLSGGAWVDEFERLNSGHKVRAPRVR
jgi:hypothetical protein